MVEIKSGILTDEQRKRNRKDLVPYHLESWSSGTPPCLLAVTALERLRPHYSSLRVWTQVSRHWLGGILVFLKPRYVPT